MKVVCIDNTFTTSRYFELWKAYHLTKETPKYYVVRNDNYESEFLVTKDCFMPLQDFRKIILNNLLEKNF
jgi:hypothetical protein